MSDSLRHRPYVFVTRITGLLAGTDKCGWKAWYKSRHKYDKLQEPDRDAFLADWTVAHDELVTKRAAELRAAGWEVRTEDEAAWKLVGANADLAGKPDIVATKNGNALVVDVKTGKPRESDQWQLLVYAFGLGLSWLKLVKNIRLEVQYRDHRVDVSPLMDHMQKQIGETVRLVSGSNPPAQVPSASECKRCDIASCKVRYGRPEGDAKGFF